MVLPSVVVSARFTRGSVHFVHVGVLRQRRITVFIELDFCYSQLIISVLHLEKTTVSVSEHNLPRAKLKRQKLPAISALTKH